MKPAPPLSARVVALGAGLAAALGVGWLVSRALFEGYAQSFDAMIYTRSLWGFARGEFFNPVLGVPSLAIHNHLILGPLSLLTLVFHPARVLLWAQAAALGASVAQVSWHAAAASERVAPWLAALVAALLATLGAPLVLNPYLYDLHPAVLGLPWMLAGLLGAVSRGQLDRKALVWMAPALLVREEFGLLIAAALLTAPSAWSWRRRLVLAGVAAAWYAGYAALVGWYVGSHGASFQQHMLTQSDSGALVWKARAVLAAAILATAGGCWWRGWRWAGAAIPGTIFLGTSQHLVEDQLTFHYGFLVAPGLLAAALAGQMYWQRAPKTRRWEPIVWVVLAALSFIGGSTAPGGGLFWAEAFDIHGFDLERRGPQRAVHAMLRQLPAEDGVAVPWRFGAPVSDRLWVRLDLQIEQILAHDGQPPAVLDSIALDRGAWASVGRALTGEHGFRLIDQARGVALLTRSPRLPQRPLPAPVVAVAIPAWPCEDGGGWPAVGLRFCGARRVEGGRVAIALLRESGAPDLPERLDPLLISAAEAPPALLSLMDGLVGAERLPVGQPWVFVSEPLPADQALGLALYAPQRQRALQARAADGVDLLELPVRLP